MRVISNLVLICTFLITSPAVAQDYAFQGFAGDMAMNQMLGANMEAMIEGGQSDSPSLRTPPQIRQQSVSPATLTYKISLQRRQANYRSFVQKMREACGDCADELQTFFAQSDPIKAVTPSLQSGYGFRANNVADAYALWMAAAWKLIHDPDSDLTRAQFEGVRAQVSQSLFGIAGMAKATDDVKQNMAEALMVQAMLLDASATQSKADPAARREVQKAVLADTRREMNIDLSAITLTDNGFVPRRGGKRGDAGEAIEGALPGASAARRL